MSQDDVEIYDTSTAEDNIRVSAIDTDILRYFEPCWDALPDRAKADLTLQLTDYGFGTTEMTSNTTCIELDEYRVDNLNEAENANHVISELAVGDDSTTPAHSDRQLTSPIHRTDVAEFTTSGQTITARIFLAKAEANDDGSGNNPTLQELGLYADTYFLNHSTFSGITKTSQKSIVFEVSLTFNTA